MLKKNLVGQWNTGLESKDQSLSGLEDKNETVGDGPKEPR
jgi:hypothetical protein